MKISRRGLLLAPLALAAPTAAVALADDDGDALFSEKCRVPLGDKITMRLVFEATQGERVIIDRCRALFPNLGNFKGYAGKGVI